ncbi:transmembrane repetitive protein, partial [Xanthomonas hortorum pv. gardneri]
DVATKADDWGKSDRNRDGKTTGADGQRDGMFNADGSVRVAAGTGDAGNGAGERGPPGSDTDTWTRDQIAQGGTWLKRPPYGYTPTSLDKYWMPNQSLLQEWVRRGLKKIEIPIPGTATKISCVVSLLQFGGGCGLSDPNLNDQPATARPPPDVPFKRELQEDNGAVR